MGSASQSLQSHQVTSSESEPDASMAPRRRITREDALDPENFLRHPNNTFECLVCPKRKGRAIIMTAGHAREHTQSGVHQRSLKATSQCSSRLSRVAWPIPVLSDILDDVQRPLPMVSLAVQGDASIRDDALFGVHPAPPSHIVDSPLLDDNPSDHSPISAENDVPLSDLFSAMGSSHGDGPLFLDESWIEPSHVGNDNDDEISIQCAQREHCTNGVLPSFLDEDPLFRTPSENDDQDDLDTDDLNIDLDGEFLL
ncbi:hypothetical protein EDB86DRAFT_853892 [Lactarius hatsudake]|nr:hypothetical protein EDB86DRAFT_853892 [Lactarius hatsudake]